jgi:ribosomal protein S18 acetylase RimI-like enzyme
VGQLRLLVDPAHRGQEIGRELARAALVQALELGLSKIIVEVVADQQPAISMFTALGFDPEALLCSHIRDRNGDFRDLIILAHMVDENWQTFGVTGIDDEIVTTSW